MAPQNTSRDITHWVGDKSGDLHLNWGGDFRAYMVSAFPKTVDDPDSSTVKVGLRVEGRHLLLEHQEKPSCLTGPSSMYVVDATRDMTGDPRFPAWRLCGTKEKPFHEGMSATFTAVDGGERSDWFMTKPDFGLHSILGTLAVSST